MQGRYGTDELSRAMIKWIIGVLIASLLFQMLGRALPPIMYVGGFLNIVGLVLIVIVAFRTLSRNIPKRREENEQYLQRRRKRTNKDTKNRNRRDYKYLYCPNCKQEMRVPRGKGKIVVKCPKSATKFESKS